jgi:CheY-like chemotaxis protein
MVNGEPGPGPLGALRRLGADRGGRSQHLVKRAVEAKGYEVVQAFDGAACLTLALTEKVDLVLLETSMPKLDGRDVLVQLKQDPSTAARKVEAACGGSSD